MCSTRMVPLTKIAPGKEFAALTVGAGDRLFVLTGAGISAESGVRTFRDSCERSPFHDDGAYLDEVPRCDRCGGLLRPHVVWFGEIPFCMERIYQQLNECDLFVTVGSSGAVHPAAGFVSHLRHNPNP